MDGQGPKEKNTIVSSRQNDRINDLQNEISRFKSELALSTKKQAVLNGIVEEGLFFHKQKKITEVNEAFCKITGYPEKALIGMPFKRLFDKASYQRLVDQIEGSNSAPVEIPLKTKNGGTVYVHAKSKSFDVENDPQQLVLVQDITEIKKTRRSLEESEERHRMISSLLSDYVYTCTIKPGSAPEIGWISGAIESICGYTAEEIDRLEQGWFSIIHPEDVQKVADSVNYNYKEDRFHNNEYRITDRDGKIRWLHDRSMRLKFVKETNELTILGATKDITYKKEIEENLRLKNLEFERLNKELQKANQELRESQKKYKSVVKNSVLGIGISHKEQILFANEALLKIYGVASLDDFAAKKLTDYMPFESQLLVKERFKKYDRNEPVEKVFRHQIIKSDGNLATVEVTSNDLLYEGRNCRQVFMKDITQELATEEALQRAASIFENILHGIIIFRLENNADDRSLVMISCNPAALRFLKSNKQEMIGGYIDDLFPYLREHDIPRVYADVVRNQAPTELDDVYYSDKSNIDGIYSVKAFPLPGNCVGISVDDVTERRQAEQDLQTRNNELNNLVYKVSHDLKAPLRSILGLINLSRLEQNFEEYLPVIEARIKSLDHFIRDILSHARNLNTEVTVEPLDVEGIVRECFEELEYLQDFVTVDKTIASTGNEFCGDKIRLTEICRNLASNSIKYCDRDKDKQYVRVKINISPNKMTMTFKDNGLGIKQEFIENIYQMFYRATDSEEGSGIGLYIVQQAIAKLNGKISVSSEYGTGTSFKVEIPNMCREVKKNH